VVSIITYLRSGIINLSIGDVHG
jgi:serine/threonine-protein phosphatase PP1 catalytic subunit